MTLEEQFNKEFPHIQSEDAGITATGLRNDLLKFAAKRIKEAKSEAFQQGEKNGLLRAVEAIESVLSWVEDDGSGDIVIRQEAAIEAIKAIKSLN